LSLRWRIKENVWEYLIVNSFVILLFTRYYSGTNSRKVWWAGNVTSIGGRRNAYRFLVRKPEGKRQFRRPTENNNRMNLYEIRRKAD
jgi:hypothetical protein